MAALAGSKVLNSSVCHALCTAALPASLHSVWLWWFIGGVAGPAGVLETGVAPSRVGVVGQLRGWLLVGTGVLHWDVGNVGSDGESNLALVARGWAKHGKASAQDAQYAACARQVVDVKPKPPW